MKRVALFLVGIVAFALPALAADDTKMDKYVELLRSDVRTARTQIVTEALDLKDQQSSAFWPVYRDYEKDLAALADKRVALIKDYAASYDTMTDKIAKDLVNRAFKINQDRTALLKKYYAKVEKVLQPKLAARWVQVENAMNSIMDIQVIANLPLIP